MTAILQWLAKHLVVPGALVALALVFVQTEWLWRVDSLVYDLFLRRPTQPVPADVLLVAIDEQSLQQIGRWPWRRTVHADLVARLSAAGVRAIALDIAFTEPDGDDAALAAAVRASGRVVLPVLHEQAAVTGVPVESLPVPELTAAAAGLGHVDVDTDPDGMVRTAYLEAGLGRPAWPGLALAMLNLDPGAATHALPGERDPEAGIPAPYAWVRDRRVLVRFAGPPGHFRRVSYVDVLRGQVAADWLRNAYIFVGPTATGLGDQVPTPVSGLSRPMAGIEFNANVLEALRTGTMMQYLTLSATNVLSGVLVFATCLALASGRRQQMPIALAAIVVTLLVSWALLMWAGRWFTPTPTIAAVLLAYPLAATRWHAQTVASERARAHQALGSLAEGVITADAQGRIDYMNPVAEAWIGAQRLGRDLGSVLQPCDDGSAREASLPPAGDGVPIDAALVTATGTRRPVRASIVRIGDRVGARQGTAVALSPRDARGVPAVDDTDDPAGGDDAVEATPARTRLAGRLARLIGEAAGTGRPVAVLLLDITQLRHVNVAFGRRGGDVLLQAVAGRLRGAIREREAVAHVGGDEFVILLDELGRSVDAVALATRLISVFDAPFRIEGIEVRVRASAGVALYPEHGGDADMLLEHAETAKSWARDHGQAPVQVYGPHMSAPALDRLVLERALQAALQADQLTMAYQPQVEMATGRVVGVEALVRWHHVQYGTIPATTFIALAEETQLIVGLGEWVLRSACRQSAQWRTNGLGPLRMAVNVSPRQFLQPGLAETIEGVLREYALEPSWLEIEITETALVRDFDRARTALEQIRAMGVGIALDDFGVGYSSLGHLSRFPVDCVKIDRSFVDNVTVDGHDRTICLAVLAMAQSMRLRVVAEGVETVDQMRFFASKGCDVVQGYYISPAVPAADVERLLRDAVTFRTTAS